jgi:hypothetical protein
MFDHFRQASSPIAKHAAFLCSAVSAARRDRAASIRDAREIPEGLGKACFGAIEHRLHAQRKLERPHRRC